MRFIDHYVKTRVREPVMERGVKMSKDVYADILSDNDVLVGFEFEFLYNEGDPPESSSDFTMEEELADHFTRVAGGKIEFSKTGVRGEKQLSKKDDTWYLERDGSLKVAEHDDYVGWELVSPPMPLSRALDAMAEVFDAMRQGDFEVPAEAGLHVNISYKSPEWLKKNFDPLKMIMLIGEEHDLQQFDRIENEYAASQIAELRKHIDKNVDTFLSNRKNVESVLSMLRKNVDLQGRRALAFNKWVEKGYVEIRILGNSDYHLRGDEVRKKVLKYAFMMKVGSSKELYRTEFLKRVYQMLTRNLNVGGDDELGPIYRRYRRTINKHPNKDLIRLTLQNAEQGNYERFIQLFVELTQKISHG